MVNFIDRMWLCGGVAFLFCPPLFGIAGVVPGIIGVSMSNNKLLGAIGIVLSIIGSVVGMVFGAIVMEYATSLKKN